jgi:dCMP deaminase
MRLSLHEWGMQLAEVTALRGTCLRRKVGCVLVDQDGHVLATGYNGVASGTPHCNDVVKLPIYNKSWFEAENKSDLIHVDHYKNHYPNACMGAGAASGTQLEACGAIHAEQNALMQCSDVRRIWSCFVTVSPCIHCLKMLLNTKCQQIIFRDEYANAHELVKMWRRAGRNWIHKPPEDIYGH